MTVTAAGDRAASTRRVPAVRQGRCCSTSTCIRCSCRATSSRACPSRGGRGTRTSTSGRGGPRVVRDYPRWRNGGFRVDAAVPGGAPGSDIDVLRAQLLDEYGTDIAILIPLTFMLEGPAAYKAALCRAINDWLAQEWLDRDPRLRGSLNVPFDSPDLAVAEIERFADDPRFVQVMVRGDTQSEWGDRKYWPIYQAAEAADFVAMCHVGGDPGNRYRGSGAPSYYLEQHVWLHMPVERLAMSMICEGVFDEFPRLQVALVEACLIVVGAAAVGDGRRLRGRGQRRAAAEQAPLGVLPGALLAEHAADRGAGQPQASCAVDRVRAHDGPGDVLLGLPALGLRLAGSRRCRAAMPAQMREKIMGENAARLYAKRLSRI